MEWSFLFGKGFHEITELFRCAAGVEKTHEERYRRLLDQVKSGKVFAGEDETIWGCRNCDTVVIDKEPSEKHLVCGHPGSCFEKKAET